MIPALEPDPEWDFQPFADSGSGSGFGSSKKLVSNTYRCYDSGTGSGVREAIQ